MSLLIAFSNGIADSVLQKKTAWKRSASSKRKRLPQSWRLTGTRSTQMLSQQSRRRL